MYVTEVGLLEIQSRQCFQHQRLNRLLLLITFTVYLTFNTTIASSFETTKQTASGLS